MPDFPLSAKRDLDAAKRFFRKMLKDEPLLSPRRKENQSGGKYYQVSLSTGHGKFHANLGRYPGQEDDSLMAVIPWD